MSCVRGRSPATRLMRAACASSKQLPPGDDTTRPAAPPCRATRTAFHARSDTARRALAIAARARAIRRTDATNRRARPLTVRAAGPTARRRSQDDEREQRDGGRRRGAPSDSPQHLHLDAEPQRRHRHDRERVRRQLRSTSDAVAHQPARPRDRRDEEAEHVPRHQPTQRERGATGAAPGGAA